jgi:hypothetical protein
VPVLLNASLGENTRKPRHVLKVLAKGWQAPYPEDVAETLNIEKLIASTS